MLLEASAQLSSEWHLPNHNHVNTDSMGGGVGAHACVHARVYVNVCIYVYVYMCVCMCVQVCLFCVEMYGGERE